MTTDNPAERRGNVVAVLGPTNTGKTHLAIERMLGHKSGIIGLPLRLLAREVYTRIVERAGVDSVALFTGEEKIVPPEARYSVCTVEAMPETVDTSFVAIDEIQLAADLERGHVFTDRILNLRGRDETLLLGSDTMRGIVQTLVPGVNVVTRPRMSVLAYTGSRKITRLPTRSAVVAFSSSDVYAIAELIRRQRGGAAVVLGALSPRTRNAQVEIYQNGDVDYLVATDAIGMGLNLDLHHVAFAGDQKYDGYQYRRLTPAEFGQIAGRAGRHVRDGTFGVTSRVAGFEDELVEDLESHQFDPVRIVQWRNRDLDTSSLDGLLASLDRAPSRQGLSKAPIAEDVQGLLTMARDSEMRDLADRPERVALLWEVCCVPDYRKIAPANHAELLSTLFSHLARDGVLPDDWFARQVAFADRTDGDIDTLANRIAHVRTWTFVANRTEWFRDPGHWQERTRAIEDRLSDALHERLTARFVDRRTSVLMRRLKENVMLEAEITDRGDVLVEGEHVGTLDGFRFAPDPNAAAGQEARAVRAAAQKALAGEIVNRADRAASAPDGEFALATDGALRWKGIAIARAIEGDDALKPRLLLIADDSLPAPARDKVQARVDLWLETHVTTLLKPLFDLRGTETLSGPARGIAYRLAENFGVLQRPTVAAEVRELDQDARAGLRTLGVRFGAHHIYVPALLKPAPAAVNAMLWALKNGGLHIDGLLELTQLAASGRTSVPVEPAYPEGLYYAVGYKPCGSRAVRLDILERLADQIRPLLAWRATPDQSTPPEGALEEYGFTVTVAMTSLLGCAGEDFASVLRALGYRSTRKPMPNTAEASPAADAPPATRASESTEPAVSPAPEPAQATVDAGAPTDTDTVTAQATAQPSPEAVPPVPETSPEAADKPSVAPPAEPAGAAVPDDEPAPETPANEAVTPPANSAPVAGGEVATGPVETDAGVGTAVTPDATEAASAPAPEAVPEAASETAPEVAPEPASEPVFIEVWRPVRADRPGNRRPRRADGEGGEDRQPRRQRSGRRRDGERKDDDRDRVRRADGGRDGPREERRDERPKRGPNRRKGKGAGSAPRQAGPRPPQRENRRPMDPDSPFAALADLKRQLESAKGDDG